MHVQEHQVGILNKLLHARAKSGTRRPIDHSMVGTDAETNDVGLPDSETVRMAVIVEQLSDPLGPANSNNCGLRT